MFLGPVIKTIRRVELRCLRVYVVIRQVCSVVTRTMILTVEVVVAFSAMNMTMMVLVPMSSPSLMKLFSCI